MLQAALPGQRLRKVLYSAIVHCVLLGLLAGIAQAGKYNPTMKIGQPAPQWKQLPGVDGKQHSLADLKDKQAIVVVFTCNSCPYAVDYEDRFNAFAAKHCGDKSKVSLIAINCNKIPADRLPAMKQRANEKQFKFPYLYDASQASAREFGATWTPECFVLDQKRRVVYMGAFDDSPDPKKAKRQHVLEAVQSVLAKQPVQVPETIAIGCRVRYERKRRRRRTTGSKELTPTK